MSLRLSELTSAELTQLNCSYPTNQVKSKVYLEYAKAVGPLLSVFICFLYGCQSAAAIGANIWLSEWTNDAIRNQTHEKVHLRVGVYAALGITQGKKECHNKHKVILRLNSIHLYVFFVVYKQFCRNCLLY